MQQAQEHPGSNPSDNTADSTVLAGAVPTVRTPAQLESTSKPVEIGGREGPEPTRFGDWEKSGRCIDF